MGIPNHSVERPNGSENAYTDRVIIGTKYIANASSPGAISSITPVLPGVFTTLPVLNASVGTGNTFAVHMKGLNGTVVAPGSGYAVNDTSTPTGNTGTEPVLTVATTKLVSLATNAPGTGYAPGNLLYLVGGTFSTAAVLQIATTKLISATLVAPGTGYLVNDTVTVAGGTHATAAILTVSKIQLVSAAKNAGGSGYVVGNVLTLVGGTFTSAATVTVASVDGGGAVLTFTLTTGGVYTVGSTTFTVTGGAGTGFTLNTSVFGIQAFTVSTAGSYTVNSATFTQAATSGGGTGATFSTASYGVNTTTIYSAGVYTVNSTTFTVGNTSGSGTGATFNTGLFGVNTFTVTTPGDVTALAANPLTQGSTSGSGTGLTVNLNYGILSVTVGGSGINYDSNTALSTTPSGGATFTFNLSNTNGVVTQIITFPQANLPAKFVPFVNMGQAGNWYADPATFTATGFTLKMTPPSGGIIAAGEVGVGVMA